MSCYCSQRSFRKVMLSVVSVYKPGGAFIKYGHWRSNVSHFHSKVLPKNRCWRLLPVWEILDPPLMIQFKDKVQWSFGQCTSLVAKHAISLNQNSCNALSGTNTTTAGIDCLAPVLSHPHLSGLSYLSLIPYSRYFAKSIPSGDVATVCVLLSD